MRFPFLRRRPRLSAADLGKLVALTIADLDLLQACAKDRLWLDARTETAYLDGDDGGRRQVDVAALRDWPGGPLVVHDAVNWALDAPLRPDRVKFRVTIAGERLL